jgi:hypothetical protein
LIYANVFHLFSSHCFVAFQGCITIQYHNTLVASLDTNNIVWIFFQKFQQKNSRNQKFVKENRESFLIFKKFKNSTQKFKNKLQ